MHNKTEKADGTFTEKYAALHRGKASRAYRIVREALWAGTTYEAAIEELLQDLGCSSKEAQYWLNAGMKYAGRGEI